ncbi:MAG: hypothetical protein NVS3B20_19340 [Polyangiales bacterium]
MRTTQANTLVSIAMFSAVVTAMVSAIGCGAAPDDHGMATHRGVSRTRITSSCGVVIAANRTDNNFCGFIQIRNDAAVTVNHWTVDIDLPSSVNVDYFDSGTYNQSGTHVQFVPDDAHATLTPGGLIEVTYCNSAVASLLAASPLAQSELCSGTATTTTTTTTVAPTTTTAATPPPSTTTTPSPTALPTTTSALGQYAVTWYSFQDNTPVNSALSSSGRVLAPYLSVAVPFRLLAPFGGTLNYGDQLYVQFLAGRTMPNGMKHSGWVQIDDFCGDSGDDSYCFQNIGGTSYPNVDLYIGDFTKSGMASTCSGPAGSGQDRTTVFTGSAGSAWIGNYGGRALGTGTCGDLTSAKLQQGSCWDYTPPASSVSQCAACAAYSCTSW